MGALGRLISLKIEEYVIGVVRKRIGEPKEDSFISPSGDDSPPLENDLIYMSEKDGKGRVVFVGSLMISQGAKKGEKILYSRNSDGVVKGKLHINENSEFVFNDGIDYAVAFEKLKIEFEKLQTKWDVFASAYVPGSPSVTGLPPTANPSGSEIDNAKVEKVRLP